MKKLASKAKQLNLRAKARVQERKEKLRRELELRRLKRIRRKNNIPPYRYCKNCGTELKGMYCHECGQYAMDSRQPFWKYFLQYFENLTLREAAERMGISHENARVLSCRAKKELRRIMERGEQI